MRRILKLSFLLVFYVFNSQTKKINEIPQSDFMLINVANVDCCISWSNNEPNKIIYSRESRNIYEIDVEALNFVNVQEKFWVADYLTDSTKVNPIKLLYESDELIENTKFSKKDSYIVYKTYTCENFECINYKLNFLNTKAFEIEKSLDINTSIYDFLTDDNFVFVENNRSNQLQIYNVKEGKITSTIKMKYDIQELFAIDEKNIFIKTEKYNYVYNLESDKYEKIYEGIIYGRPNYVNHKIYGTFDNVTSKYYDVKTKKLETISFPYCYEPVVNKNDNYIAMIMEGQGIIIKKVK